MKRKSPEQTAEQRAIREAINKAPRKRPTVLEVEALKARIVELETTNMGKCPLWWLTK